MPTMQIELPDAVLLSLKETPEGLAKMVRMAAAAKLYELGKLSSGRAADLAGIPRVSFLQALGQYGVPILAMTEEELVQDLRSTFLVHRNLSIRGHEESADEDCNL